MRFLYLQKNQLLMIGLCCLLFVWMIEPWNLYFLNDDFLHIPMNNDRLFLRSGFMRPVPNFLLLWDKWLYGKNSNGFFFTSLSLHVLCVFSVYFLVKKVEQVFLKPGKVSLLAFITTLLFLLYPYHAEPVMWVIGRVAILAALLSFLSLLFYLKSNTSVLNLIVSWVFFFLALFTYESIWNIVLLFAIISIANVRQGRTTFSGEWKTFAVMLITFVAYAGFRWYTLGTLAGDGYDTVNPNLHKFQLLAVNLVKLSGRNFTPPFIHSSYWVIFFVISLLLYAWCLYKVFQKNKPVAFFLLLLWLAMVTGVVTATPLGIDTHYNESERYIYYSSFFYCWFIASLIVFFLSGKYQVIFTVALGLVFSILLLALQKNYKKASAITKATVKLYSSYPNFKRAIMIDLPEKYKGTMVLRLSPKRLMEWMVPQAQYDTILVVSHTVNMPVFLPYTTGEKNREELFKAKHWDMNMAGVPDSLGRNIPVTATDGIFWYTPDGLYKINFPAK